MRLGLVLIFNSIKYDACLRKLVVPVQGPDRPCDTQRIQRRIIVLAISCIVVLLERAAILNIHEFVLVGFMYYVLLVHSEANFLLIFLGSLTSFNWSDARAGDREWISAPLLLKTIRSPSPDYCGSNKAGEHV